MVKNAIFGSDVCFSVYLGATQNRAEAVCVKEEAGEENEVCFGDWWSSEWPWKRNHC